MKKTKKKLALSFIGVMVIIVGSGFMQIGHAAATTAEPETALSNFTVAFNNLHKTVTSALPPMSGGTGGVVDQGQLTIDRALLDEAYKAIVEGLKAAQEQLAESQRDGAPDISEDLENLLGFQAAKEIADRFLNRRSTTPSQPQQTATTISTPAPAVLPEDENPEDDDDLDDDDISDDDVVDSSETPNSEGETPINGIETVGLFGKTPTFQDLRLVFINPNPEVSTTSSTNNPFAGARPTIDLRAPVINDGVSAINLKGLAIPNINLREAVINPDPEGATAPSIGTSPFQIAPTISNPILPKSAVTPYLNKTFLQKSLSTEQGLLQK